MKRKHCLRRKTNHKTSFIEKCYRFFFLLSFFQPTAHLRDFGQDSYKSNRTGLLQTSISSLDIASMCTHIAQKVRCKSSGFFQDLLNLWKSGVLAVQKVRSNEWDWKPLESLECITSELTSFHTSEPTFKIFQGPLESACTTHSWVHESLKIRSRILKECAVEKWSRTFSCESRRKQIDSYRIQV